MNTKKKFFTDNRIALILRMWGAGAVFLLFAMTPLGKGDLEGGVYLYTLLISLSIGTFIMERFVINPVIRGMLNTKLNEEKRKYFEIPLLERINNNIKIILKDIFLVIIIMLIFFIMNNLILIPLGVTGRNGRTNPLNPEPFSFGILYGFIYIGIESLTEKIRERKINKNNVNKEIE